MADAAAEEGRSRGQRGDQHAQRRLTQRVAYQLRQRAGVLVRLAAVPYLAEYERVVRANAWSEDNRQLC